MKISDSIRLSIDDWERGEFEAAILHACNAVDGTARKLFPKLGSNERFTHFLRENFNIFGPMGVPGINLNETRFPVSVKRPKASGGKPDVADVIYGIHRCCHGHGDEMPDGFELIPDAAGPRRITRLEIENGKVRFSDRIIFGLISVAVLDTVNVGQKVPNGYHLVFGNSGPLYINEWWGKKAEFQALIDEEPIPLVKLDFGDWEG